MPSDESACAGQQYHHGTLLSFPHPIVIRYDSAPGCRFSSLHGGSMKSWREALRAGVLSGSIASVLSAAVLAWRGQRECGSCFGPTNAISHWIWGDEATLHDEPSLRHTAAGYVIHHASSLLWAVVYERLIGERADRKEAAPAMAGAAAIAALACFVDYKLTPHRFEPGFEQRLSNRSLCMVYGAFGAGLAVCGLLVRGTVSDQARQNSSQSSPLARVAGLGGAARLATAGTARADLTAGARATGTWDASA
jgi:hypothetical protein